MKPWKEKFLLKGQANISKHSYWGETIDFRDMSNQPLGTYVVKSSDIVLGMTATIHFRLSDKFSVGTGLGADVLIQSVTKLPELPFGKKEVVRNRMYKPIMPVIPVEISLLLNKVLLNVRYEHGLLNRFKKDLAKEKKEGYSLLALEIGYRIK